MREIIVAMLAALFLLSGCGSEPAKNSAPAAQKTPASASKIKSTRATFGMTPEVFRQQFNQQVSDALELKEPEISGNYATFKTKNVRILVESKKDVNDELWSVSVVCNFISEGNLSNTKEIYRTAIKTVAPDIDNSTLESIFNTLGISSNTSNLKATANYYSGTAGSNVDFQVDSRDSGKIIFTISAADLTDEQKQQISAKNLPGEQAAAEFIAEQEAQRKAEAEEAARLKAEQDAQREAERQAREEQRRIEAEERAERQREQALARTFQITPEEFQQLFSDCAYKLMINDLAYAMGVTGLVELGEPQIKTLYGKQVAHYEFVGGGASMDVYIDSITGKIDEVAVFAYLSRNNNMDEFRNNMMMALLVYPVAILATNPNLSDSEIGLIQQRLGLEQDISQWINDSSTTYGGRYYAKQAIKGLGLKFSISVR